MAVGHEPPDHQVVPIRGLANERSLVDVVQKHLRAEVHVGADRGHDRREDAAHRQPQQPGRQVVAEQHAVGELLVDGAVAQARPSHCGAERGQRDQWRASGTGSPASRRTSSRPRAALRHDRMRWPSIAPDIGAASPPYPTAVPIVHAITPRTPRSSWCIGGCQLTTPSPNAPTSAWCRPAGPPKSELHGPDERQRRPDDHERLEEIGDHDADVAGQQHVEKDDRNDDGEGGPEIPAEHGLGDLVHAEESGAGPGDDGDERAPQRHPRANRDGGRAAEAKLVELRRGHEREPPPEHGEQHAADHQGQTKAAEIPPADEGAGDHGHAAIGGRDVRVQTGRGIGAVRSASRACLRPARK